MTKDRIRKRELELVKETLVKIESSSKHIIGGMRSFEMHMEEEDKTGRPLICIEV